MRLFLDSFIFTFSPLVPQHRCVGSLHCYNRHQVSSTPAQRRIRSTSNCIFLFSGCSDMSPNRRLQDSKSAARRVKTYHVHFVHITFNFSTNRKLVQPLSMEIADFLRTENAMPQRSAGSAAHIRRHRQVTVSYCRLIFPARPHILNYANMGSGVSAHGHGSTRMRSRGISSCQQRHRPRRRQTVRCLQIDRPYRSNENERFIWLI